MTPTEARKWADLAELDYCSCLPAYKDRGISDPQCQSCNTHDERHDYARILRDLAQQVEDLQKDAARLDWLEASKESHGFCHKEWGEYRYYAHQIEGYPTVRQAIDEAMK